jgi:hypothetical protein
MIKAMPKPMPGSMGMPANLNPVFLAIQNIGTCKQTPMLTTAEPDQKASAFRRSANRKTPGITECPSALESGYPLGDGTARQAHGPLHRLVKIGGQIFDRDIAPEEIRPDEFRKCGGRFVITALVAHVTGQ